MIGIIWFVAAAWVAVQTVLLELRERRDARRNARADERDPSETFPDPRGEKTE